MILPNHGPWAKSIFVSKVLLENSHTRSHMPTCGCFCAAIAELSSAAGYMGRKVQNIYAILLKSLPACGLNTPIKRPKLLDYVWKADF